MSVPLIRFVRRLAALLRPGRADAALDREIASHLGLLEDEYRRRGLSPLDARRAARIALGGIEQVREQHRDARAYRWIDHARRDIGYAVRRLRHHPLSTATAALSLGVAIGLNAAIFSVVDWVLLRPLPYPNPEQLVHVYTAANTPVSTSSSLVQDEVTAFSAAKSVASAVAFSSTTRMLAGDGIEPIHVMVYRVREDLFATLGVQPSPGRGFSDREVNDGLPVVVLDHDLWQRHFSGDRAIVGRTILIDGAPHTAVGVMPASRGYPRDAQVWRPFTRDERAGDDRDLNMIARLRSGVGASEATAEISALAQAVSAGTRQAWVDDVQRRDASSVKSALQVLFGAAMLTLLVACANVAALVGAGSAARTAEMAVRSALGATRARMFGQLMVESLVLGLAGGALGLLLGRWALHALVAVAPVTVPRLDEITLDGRIVTIGLAASLVTGLIVGLMPAFRLSRPGRTIIFSRLMSQRATAPPGGRRTLVLAQIALAVMLTAGAGLLIRSLQHLVALDHGFAPDQLIAVRLFPPGSFVGDPQRLFQELAAQSRAIPRVEAVSVVMRLPTQVTGLRATVRISAERPDEVRAVWRPVSPTYFDTVRIPVRSGRGFDDSDQRQAPRVAIVNMAFVREHLGGRSPLGLRVTTSFGEQPVSIIGVAGDVTPAGQSDRPAMYVPIDQAPIGEGHLLVRVKGDPDSLIAPLRSHLASVTSQLAFDRIERVAASLEDSRAVTRFITQIATVFASLSLVLSMIGIYGLIAADVAARRRELAIRLALGESRRGAFWTVIRPGAAILLSGATLGVIGAAGSGPVFSSLLYGIGSRDAGTLTFAPVLLVVVGLLAAALAARRALRSDPAVMLRSE